MCNQGYPNAMKTRLTILVVPLIFFLALFHSSYADESARVDTASPISAETTGSRIALEQVLSPDGKQLICVKQVARLKDNPSGIPEDDASMMYTAWSPMEIWTAKPDGSEARLLLRSRYTGNSREDRGWFSDLNFSPDSKKIYYVCNPACPTTNAIHSVNRDGTDDRWICWGNSVDVVGGKPGDRWYGYLVVEQKNIGSDDIPVLIAPEGSEKVILPTLDKFVLQALKVFWKEHTKVK